MNKRIIYIIALVGFLSIGHSSFSQQSQTTRILFVFDASQSMLGRWHSNTKMDVAVRLMNELVDSLRKETSVDLAIRIYGHQSYFPPQDCNDTKLEIPFAKNNHDKIKNLLKSIQPRGTTPIAKSLEATKNDFPPCNNCRNIVILITDGREECGGDPCAISNSLQRNGVILKPFIIGIGLGDDIKTSLKCVGSYYDASTEESFRDVLKIVISQALYPTTAQINILDSYKKPTETNIPFTLYDSKSGRIVYNFVHTLNHKDNPDTLNLDNFITYKLKVHTIPPVEKDDITITPGRHNVIAVDAPQGSLLVKINGRNQYGNLKCIVRKSNEMQTLNIQDAGRQIRYLTGKYDLEILTLPRISIKNVSIDQSTVTNIDIEEAGLVNFQAGYAGYGSVFQIKNNNLEFVCNIDESSTHQSLVLQPGEYKIIFRYKFIKETILSKERKFKVNPGESQTVNLIQ